MKRLLLLIIVSAFSPLFIIAQSNYKNGIIVTYDGDTIKGYIDDRDWIYNPFEVQFRSEQKVESEIFTPIIISSFQIEGEDLYKSFPVSISMDEVRLTILHQGPDTSSIFKTVFLKVLVEGDNINLYEYTDNIKSRFFYKKPSMEYPQELRYRVYKSMDRPEKLRTHFSTDTSQVITDNFYLRCFITREVF
ncbi:MAG: hypothetical protein HC905_15750 [Bacteroidales bacterium]|nr:hypothetical protein [Bacteroidales bacterium]